MYDFLQRHPRLSAILDTTGSLILANLIAVVVALPLITLPPALAALFAFTSRIVRGENPVLFSTLLRAFRLFFVRSWLIVLANLFVLAGLAANFLLGRTGQVPLGGVVATIALLLATVWLAVNLYLWPLLVLVDQPLGRLLVLAARLALGHLVWSWILLGLVAIAAFLATAFPGLLAVGALSSITLLINWGTWRVIRRYISSESPAADSG